MASFYRPLLRRALALSWRRKSLWLLGFLAAFVSNGSLYQFVSRSFAHLSEGGTLFSTLFEYYNSGIFGLLSFSLLKELWLTDFSAFALLLFSLILSVSVLLFLVSLGIIGQAGVIYGLIKTDEGNEKSLKECFHLGVEKFWTVLSINLFAKVLLFSAVVLVVYLASLLIGLIAPFAQTFLYALVFMLFALSGIVIYFLTVYATAAAVLRGRGWWASLRYGWLLFRRRVWLNLEVGLLMFLLSVAATLLFVGFSLLLCLPAIPFYILAIKVGLDWLLGLVGLILVIILGLSAVVFGSWFNTFQLAVWSVLFEEQSADRAQSKLKRVVHHFKDKLATRRAARKS